MKKTGLNQIHNNKGGLRIAFVNPPLSLEERYGRKSRSGGETQPLGLANLAAVTREAGFETEIIDAEALHLAIDKAAAEVLKLQPDVVGITAVTISVHNAAAVCRAIKQKKPEIICVVGGHHFTSSTAETMQLFPCFDFGVVGEGEITVVELLKMLAEKTTKEKAVSIPGLAFRENGAVHINERRERIKDLDSLPMPAFDLLPDLAIFYSPPVHTVKHFPACNLVTSRGCPGQCIFCDRSVYGNRGTIFSAEYVMKMLRTLHYSYGINEIQFRDDNFLVFRKRLLQICRMLQEEKMDLVWTCLGRVDMVTPSVLKEMARAGCWQIWFGLESGSDAILKKLKKGITTIQIEEAVRACRKEGIHPCGSFIVGSPGETKATAMQTIDFAKKLPLAEAHCCFMTPFPGSELYNNWKKHGSFENDWRSLHGWEPVFVPEGMTREELVQLNKRFFRSFYLRPKIVVQYLCKIKSFKHIKFYFLGFLALLELLFASFKSRQSSSP